MAALGAQVLHEMGFTNVAYMDGGMRGWKAAGLPTSEEVQQQWSIPNVTFPINLPKVQQTTPLRHVGGGLHEL